VGPATTSGQRVLENGLARAFHRGGSAARRAPAAEKKEGRGKSRDLRRDSTFQFDHHRTGSASGPFPGSVPWGRQTSLRTAGGRERRTDGRAGGFRTTATRGPGGGTRGRFPGRKGGRAGAGVSSQGPGNACGANGGRARRGRSTAWRATLFSRGQPDRDIRPATPRGKGNKGPTGFHNAGGMGSAAGAGPRRVLDFRAWGRPGIGRHLFGGSQFQGDEGVRPAKVRSPSSRGD